LIIINEETIRGLELIGGIAISMASSNGHPILLPSGIGWNIGNYYNERKRKRIVVVEGILLSLSIVRKSVTNENILLFLRERTW
jgi:hypothetical protein